MAFSLFLTIGNVLLRDARPSSHSLSPVSNGPAYDALKAGPVLEHLSNTNPDVLVEPSLGQCQGAKPLRVNVSLVSPSGPLDGGMNHQTGYRD
jgi:hypothetical protein